MGTFLQDVRFALRTLRRTPAFPVAAVGTLAIGIAATTAIFSTVNAVLLKPLPYPNPGDLYSLRTALNDGRVTTGMLSPIEIIRLNDPALSIVRAAGLQGRDVTLLQNDGTPVRGYAGDRKPGSRCARRRDHQPPGPARNGKFRVEPAATTVVPKHRLPRPRLPWHPQRVNVSVLMSRPRRTGAPHERRPFLRERALTLLVACPAAASSDTADGVRTSQACGMITNHTRHRASTPAGRQTRKWWRGKIFLPLHSSSRGAA